MDAHVEAWKKAKKEIFIIEQIYNKDISFFILFIFLFKLFGVRRLQALFWGGWR